MKYDLTLSQFNKFSNEDKEKYLNNIRKLFIEQLWTRDEVKRELNISTNLIKYLLKEYNIIKTPEQIKATTERTCMLKYGVKSTNQLDAIKKKQAETCIKNYGVSSPLKIDAIRNKLAIENGCSNVFQLNSVKEKIKQNNLKKYGVEHVSQRKDIKEKIAKTNLEKYGSPCAMSSKMSQKQIRKNNLEKYGVEWNTQRQEIKDKLKNTCLEKYGVPYYCMTPQCRQIAHTNSQINKRFIELLTSFGIKCSQEYAIENRSYDIKVDNILLEINPTYSHNSTEAARFKGFKDDKKPIHNNYHIMKSQLAQENGFFCIHIWDWDDKYKIVNMLIPKEVIYARKCELKEVSKKECDDFLNLYHLQNTCRGQIIRYGLYYNNTLIQIMTFGKPRYNKNYEWELLRLCSHKDYRIVGGSEKLWNHFLKEKNPTNIISYCDNSKFSGDVYKRLNMKLESFGKPGCNWSKGIKRITQNLLNQRGADQLIGTNDGSNSSNREIMIREGWREVYDCGQSTYTWNK